ncbi:hypothetical protein Pan258_45160 [Symmachiella dynata]|nr:hypothetical protein Pan258_45160 [Symmachiella dynata]
MLVCHEVECGIHWFGLPTSLRSNTVCSSPCYLRTTVSFEKIKQMSFLEILVLLLIAGICGGLAQALCGYSRGGCLISIVIGFIGAFLGTWLARLAELPEMFAITIGDTTFPILWSIIGGALFAAIIGFITQRPAK